MNKSDFYFFSSLWTLSGKMALLFADITSLLYFFITIFSPMTLLFAIKTNLLILWTINLQMILFFTNVANYNRALNLKINFSLRFRILKYFLWRLVQATLRSFFRTFLLNFPLLWTVFWKMAIFIAYKTPLIFFLLWTFI